MSKPFVSQLAANRLALGKLGAGNVAVGADISADISQTPRLIAPHRLKPAVVPARVWPLCRSETTTSPLA